jgi:hypothetical protein
MRSEKKSIFQCIHTVDKNCKNEEGKKKRHASNN